MRRLFLAPAAALVCAALSAHADTVSIFNVGNQAGTSNIGTVTIDTTTGSYLNLALSFTVNGVVETFSGVPVSQSFNRSLDEYEADVISGGNELIFELPGVLSLADFVPADKRSCRNNSVNCDYLANVLTGVAPNSKIAGTFEGDLSLVSTTTTTGVTPEPSSLALLGTGLLAALGAVRRRARVPAR